MELDPYKELEIDYNANFLEIRKQYKKLALRHHPDRGGNRLKFERLKSAYKYLYNANLEMKRLQERQSKKPSDFLFERKGTFLTNEIEKNVVSKIYNKKTKRFDNKKFNALYDQTRIKDVNDDGYGDGSNFDPDKHKNLQIQIVKEPEPINTDNGFKKIGEDSIRDFGQKKINAKVNYTDYNKAFVSEDITTNYNNRKNYKNVNELKNDRSKISYKMSEKDKRKYELKKIEEQKMEKLRLHRDHLLKQQEQKSMRRLQNYLQY